MADTDPELAFLNAQKEDDPSGDFSNTAGDPDEDDYDPSAPLATYDAHTPSEHSASMPESATNTPPVAADSALKPQPSDAAAAPTPSKQSRTRGGFVDDSEDDEVEVPVSRPKAAGTALLNAGGSDSPQRSLSHTPANNTTLAPSHVPLHSTQDQAVSGVSSSSSVTVPDQAAAFASATPNGTTPVPDAINLALPVQSIVPTSHPPSNAATPTVGASSRTRLPQDRAGIFEDRIAEDPRGDIEAWTGLIDEYRKRNKFDDARAVYERFLKVFPTAAEQWTEYANMEAELGNLQPSEQIIGRAIPQAPHMVLWMTYLNHSRRVHNMVTNPNARGILQTVYDYILANAGIDVDSGRIWLDYIEFIKSAPGTLGGSGWQDTQKMDMLRKAYQTAIAIPHNATMELWRAYNAFETEYNKAMGRKNLAEHSSFYMTARAYVQTLPNHNKGVNRTTLPKLPPAPFFDGHKEYMDQVAIWNEWIKFEKKDPLELLPERAELYKKRVVYLYKQAVLALRFWPEIWFDAAEWCFQNDLSTEGDDFLDRGFEANPESCLLAFRKAHQIELTGHFDDADTGAVRKGDAVREPFNKLLDTLYALTTTIKKREESALARIREGFALQLAAEESAQIDGGGSDNGSQNGDSEEKIAERRQEKEAALQEQLKGVSAAFNVQITELKKTISYAWIALMRTMRRIQGKGRPDPPAGTGPGFRGIFAEARKKGKLLSDAYVASALIEHHCYQDPAATKIFERGMKLFPDDEHFALEYIKHLVKQNDATNARAVFETVITRLTGKPNGAHRTKPLFLFFHDYESQFGELTQIVKLEKRMSDLFPEDPQLSRFAQRFSTSTFDPTTVRPIISPKTQMRPTLPAIIPTVEEPTAAPIAQPQKLPVKQPSPGINSPRVPAAQPHLGITNSPKRPFEDFDNELAQPRKIARGESPLKGAAGRRLAANRGNAVRGSEQPTAGQPARLPAGINFLLGIIPGAHTYRETRLDPAKIVSILQNVDLGRANLDNHQPPGQAPTPTVPMAVSGAPVHMGYQVTPVQQQGQWGAPPQQVYGAPPGYYGR